jgi:hypothetical protein
MWLTEAIIALIGILSFVFILESKRMFNATSQRNEISKV